ncbi:type IV pilin [Alicyclobacillus hesperidum URH17-3-68]|nr:type IV pilin [Alicyclobacillus hesperidum URH17-3-68]
MDWITGAQMQIISSGTIKNVTFFIRNGDGRFGWNPFL